MWRGYSIHTQTLPQEEMSSSVTGLQHGEIEVRLENTNVGNEYTDYINGRSLIVAEY